MAKNKDKIAKESADNAKAWGRIVGKAAGRTATLREQIREDRQRGPRLVQIEDLD